MRRDTAFSRILVVRTDRIGDVILTTPALTALRKAMPDSKIDLLVAPLTKSLVEKNPCINEILIDDKKGVHKGLFGFFRLIKDIRARKYDLVINFHTKRRTNVLCFFAGIPARLGYKNNKFGFLLNRQVKDERAKGKKHEAQYCLDLLNEIGIKEQELDLHVSIDMESENWFTDYYHLRNIDGPNQLVVFHPGASDPSKMWPAEYFAQLADVLISQHNMKIVIVGEEKLEGQARIILNGREDHVVNLVGKTTVSQLVSVFNHVRLVVSNDSGPVHIAAALGTPVVSIFTRNQPGINPCRWRPISENSRYVSVDFDDKVSFLKAGDATSEYLRKIQPFSVLEKIKELL